MAGGSGEENPVGINVTALVDIIFCLCLFFMCSLKFRTQDGSIDSWLPRDRGFDGSRATLQPEEIRVLLSYDASTGKVQRLFGRRPIAAGAAGDRDLATLFRSEREHFRNRGAEPIVIIDAGWAVPLENIVDVLDLARGEGIEKVEYTCGSSQTAPALR